MRCICGNDEFFSVDDMVVYNYCKKCLRAYDDDGNLLKEGDYDKERSQDD